MSTFFQTKIDFIKGMGSQRAELLQKELDIFTFADLLEYYPFRYEDRTQFLKISQLNEDLPGAQIVGKVIGKEIVGNAPKQRLVVTFADETGRLELVWFQSISYFQKFLQVNGSYIVYGKPTQFGHQYSITHPEVEIFIPEKLVNRNLLAIYPLTEKLRRRFLDFRQFKLWFEYLIPLSEQYFGETIPNYILQKLKLVSRAEAFRFLHLPHDYEQIKQAHRRLKFEELFYNQLKLLSLNLVRRTQYNGQIFNRTSILTKFYKEFLPFDLTDAQKRVIREIFEDLKSGKQMNRLLQGDVGSGKTIVAFVTMLMAINGNAQACIIAPTEILAQQHFIGLSKYAALLNLNIGILTGSVSKKNRIGLHENLQNGHLNILVGTHAILEETVKFQNLGLAIIDEQHRFGVAQRAKLWDKNPTIPPHIIVMTATPIPRTLAMTLYGDLDISEIDELPPGRRPIKTLHKYDSNRLTVFQFIRDQMASGRQIYIVYPLIEESEKLDLKFIHDGYEAVRRAFPEVGISMVHGKMKAKEKESEMARFKANDSKIMIATTVIEVGVDVPNASVMVIENAERFGLSQLHQLRGRVGRGADQSYCILMTKYNLGKDTKKRIETMVRTENGFDISKVDLELRGPGDMGGTVQSGIVDLKLADLAKDEGILKTARNIAFEILEKDPLFDLPEHQVIKNHLATVKHKERSWSKIS